jgi:hypothetical protein
MSAIGNLAPEVAIRKPDGTAMSAFHPEADIAQLRSHVRVVPILLQKSAAGDGRSAI